MLRIHLCLEECLLRTGFTLSGEDMIWVNQLAYNRLNIEKHQNTPEHMTGHPRKTATANVRMLTSK